MDVIDEINKYGVVATTTIEETRMLCDLLDDQKIKFTIMFFQKRTKDGIEGAVIELVTNAT